MMKMKSCCLMAAVAVVLVGFSFAQAASTSPFTDALKAMPGSPLFLYQMDETTGGNNIMNETGGGTLLNGGGPGGGSMILDTNGAPNDNVTGLNNSLFTTVGNLGVSPDGQAPVGQFYANTSASKTSAEAFTLMFQMRDASGGGGPANPAMVGQAGGVTSPGSVDCSDGACSGSGWIVYGDRAAGGALTVDFFGGGSVFSLADNSGANVLDGNWHNVAVTYNGAGGANGSNLSLFVDDNAKVAGAGSGNIPATSGSNIFLGNCFSCGNVYTGLLDNVWMSNSSLNESDVRNAFALTVIPEPASMVLMGLGAALLARRRQR